MGFFILVLFWDFFGCVLFCYVLFRKNGKTRTTPKKRADTGQFDRF